MRWQFEWGVRKRWSLPRHITEKKKKSLTCFRPIQRMFNCFKCSDGKVSHVWGVITPRSKFILVLRENMMVNISLLSQQLARSHLFSSLWWGRIWKRHGGLSLSQSLTDHKLFPLTTYSLRFCDQHIGLIAISLWVQLHLKAFLFSRHHCVTCIPASGLVPAAIHSSTHASIIWG